MSLISQKHQLTKHPYQSIDQSRIYNREKYKMTNSKLSRSLQKMIQLSTKTHEISTFLKGQIFHIQPKIHKEKKQKKAYRKFLRHEAISHLENRHEKFFVPTLEMKSQEKGSTLQGNKCIQQQSSIGFEPLNQSSENISPLQSLKNTIYRNPKQKTKSSNTIQSNANSNLYQKIKNRLITSNLKSQIRKSNTFLFSLPSKITRKITSNITNSEIVYQWEQGLMQVMNRIQGSKSKLKQHLKVDRVKLRQYLKRHFVNETLTKYYECSPLISFPQMKKIVLDLIRLARRQASLLTFFTYDSNNDGFICEEDIYTFIQKLNHSDKIMEDFNLIIQFLRKNKVRSTQVNLPKKLLLNKSKKTKNQTWNESKTCNIRSIRQKHKHKIANNFFSLLQDQQEEKDQEKQVPFYKKFQINFDVFNLIFAEKRPVLIQEIIKKLTEDVQIFFPKIIEEIGLMNVKTEPTEQFLYTRSEEWKIHMQRSQQLRSNAQIVKNNLTYILQ